MALLSIVSKQLQRQTMLQPRVLLPAGRTVSLEEGRRLARLVREDEERTTSSVTGALEKESTSSPVVLEEGVSKRILLLRQRSHKQANIKAAIAHAQRGTKKNAAAGLGDDVRSIANRLLRKDGNGSRLALNERRQRDKKKKSSIKKK